MLDDFRPKRGSTKNIAKKLKLDRFTATTDTLATTEDTTNDEVIETLDTPIESVDTQSDKRRGDKWRKWISFRRTSLSKRQWALVIAILAVLLAGGIWAGLKLYNHARYLPPTKKETAIKKPPVVVKPTTEPSHLTGLPVDPALNQRPVTGVMIENSPDARPQSGLNTAGVVFEAIAEGGITRFLALYQEAQPDYIGPVRSARPYFLDWALGFNASYAHVGGSPEALGLIKSLGVRDLDQFANGSYYTRISSRYAPHNVYTSMANLDKLNQSKGYTSSAFTSWPRKGDKPATTPTARTIDLSISGYLYNVHYDYDAKSNSYLRSEGGQPHKDERSGQQIAPKVVVAMVMDHGLESDGIHSTYNSVGSGHVFVFQDGVVTEGTWQKTDHSAPLTFTDATGTPIHFNAGQTWLTMVGDSGSVVYKP